MQQLQMTTFVCIIAIINFCLFYCKWKLLSVPFLYIYIIQVPPFCMYYWSQRFCYALLHMMFLQYDNQNIQLILHLTTFVCTFCKWKPFYWMSYSACIVSDICYVWLQMMFHLYTIENFTDSIALLQLITRICTVAKNCFVSTTPIHIFCIHYLILQVFASLLQMTNFFQ